MIELLQKKKKRISIEIKELIISKKREVLSITGIARTLNLPVSNVSLFVDRYEKTGCLENMKFGDGGDRRSILTQEHKDFLSKNKHR